MAIKIDRLIGIITLLLQKDKVTAPYLAEKFEVSRRTINRDIEDICRAGIPVVTMQGYDGGITIAEGFKIDKALFTADELKAIFSGLQSLDSVAQSSYARSLADKLPGSSAVYAEQGDILIDLSSHYKDSLTPKIEKIKQAISEQVVISFRYYSSKSEMERAIEPYILVFKWSSWYVFGYCTDRKAFRLFKLNRLWDLKRTDRVFEKRTVPPEKLNFDTYFREEIQLVALFNIDAKYRLIEEYGIESFTKADEGKLVFKTYFTNEENLLSWILSFGSAVEVLEPPTIRRKVEEHAVKMLEKYK